MNMRLSPPHSPIFFIIIVKTTQTTNVRVLEDKRLESLGFVMAHAVAGQFESQKLTREMRSTRWLQQRGTFRYQCQ